MEINDQLFYKTLCLLRWYRAQQGDVEFPREFEAGRFEDAHWPGKQPGTRFDPFRPALPAEHIVRA